MKFKDVAHILAVLMKFSDNLNPQVYTISHGMPRDNIYINIDILMLLCFV